jgi:hypothetical protein
VSGNFSPGGIPMNNFCHNIWQSFADSWVRNPWHHIAYKKEILPLVKNEIDIQRLKLKKLDSISTNSCKNISTSCISAFICLSLWLNLHKQKFFHEHGQARQEGQHRLTNTG